MYCQKCGTKMEDGVKICPNCGAACGIESKLSDFANSAEKEMDSALNDIRVNIGNSDLEDDKLKEDRGLLSVILLSIITCGIYRYYFIYRLAQDVNVACADDGKKTPGLLEYILLSIITCGFYSWYWEYQLGNRLSDNATYYGFHFQENGTTILLWDLVGALVCGIGPFIALSIIIKNTNLICHYYNQRS